MLGRIIILFLAAAALVQLTVHGETCLKPGKTCSSNCSQILFCPIGNDEDAIEVQTCDLDNGEICNQNGTGAFLCGPGTCAGDISGIPFQCTGGGLYPDPVNCSKYYLCVSGQVQPIQELECKDGHFDHVSKTCKTGNDNCIASNPCTGGVGSCDSIQPYGSDGQQETLYAYVCIEVEGVLYPLVFACVGVIEPNECTCPNGSGGQFQPPLPDIY